MTTVRLHDLLVASVLGFTPVISFFLSQLPSNLTERNSTKTCYMLLGSECDLKTRVQNLGYPLP